MKTRRDYKSSSSFKVATLFSILLTFVAAALCISIYVIYKQHDDAQFKNVYLLFTIISLISLALVAVAGYLISIFVVSRINRITDIADEIISTGDLSKRIDIDSRWDDLSFLSNILNAMLDKLETSMEGVQHITDTVAHDLRTPLARVRNKLEEFDTESKDSKYIYDTKITLVSEVDRLLKTFNALLSLSSLESGRQGLKFNTLKLDKVVKDAVDLYLPIAEEKQQRLELTTQNINTLGDRDLLFQVVANLLDNAIKFTPKGGKISVSLRKYDDKSKLIVSDNGPGVPENVHSKVFERFYRSEVMNDIKEGSGLGLSLVLAVVKLHHAEIKLENNNPGLKVSVTFNK